MIFLLKESTPQHEIQRWSLLHTYVSTVDSLDRERRAADHDGPAHSRRNAAMAE